MFIRNEVSEFFNSIEGQKLIGERIRRLAQKDVHRVGELNVNTSSGNSR